MQPAGYVSFCDPICIISKVDFWSRIWMEEYHLSVNIFDLKKVDFECTLPVATDMIQTGSRSADMAVHFCML